MLLVVDIGNTNITMGLFDGNVLIQTFRLSSDISFSIETYQSAIQNLLSEYDITDCVIGSVVTELNDTLQKAINNAFGTESILLTNESKFGIKLDVEKPKEVGMDRIANSSSAYKICSSSTPVIVIDFGTAITFDIVNKDGDFIGGLIMPGLKMQLKSLGQNTSKLPTLEIDSSNCAIAKNTKDSILAGVIRGTACAVDGMIKQSEAELSETAIIIGTGGYAGFISEYMARKFDYLNPNLTLEGLKYIYELNNGVKNGR